MTFVVKYIRSMFMTFDGIIYSFVEKIYNLFLQIASVNFFETDIYTAFQSRIYIFLSVIMLFKLSFSLLTYIVNPDNFSDKEKGMGKLVMNSIIVICLIAFVPTIFDYSRRLQTAIVSENIIPSFILGTETGTVSIDDAGKNMSFITFSAFFQLDKDFLYAYTEDDEELYNTCRNDLYAMSYSYADGDNVTGINNDCIELINNIDGLKFDEAFWDSSVSNVGDVLSRAASYQDVKYLADSGVVNVYAEVDGGEKYIIDYSFIISTIAGVFLAWIFLIFCFDIAVRAVKLAFLELVAPIPIISYLDPKSGKSGVFSRWTKECLKTYADLFIRLIAIFFALFVISRVGGLTFYEGTYSGSVPVFVKVFIILGVLLFAKQLPKLLENILGVKMDGKFTLSPMNRLRQAPILGAAVGRTAGTVYGAAIGRRAAQESGTSTLRGMAKGAIYGNREAANNISWGGGDGKRIGIMNKVGNRTMQELTGHALVEQSLLRRWGTKEATERSKSIKEAQARYGDKVAKIKGTNALLETQQSEAFAKGRNALQQNNFSDNDIRSIEMALMTKDFRGLSNTQQNAINTYYSEYNSIAKELESNNQKIAEYERNIQDLTKENAQVKASAGIDDVKKSKADELIEKSKDL